MDGQSIGAVGCSTQFNSPHLYTGIINTQRGGMTRILKPSRSRTLFSSPQLSGCTCWVEYNICLCWPAPWVAWHTFSGTCETTVLDLTCRRPITSSAWSTAPKTTGADRRKSRNNLVRPTAVSRGFPFRHCDVPYACSPSRSAAATRPWKLESRTERIKIRGPSSVSQ